MNKYEITVVVKPNLEEEALNNEFQQIQELIERFNGTVEKVDDWGKRRLAYEIQKINEGFYRFFTVTGDGALPAEVESRIRLRENVLRYLIIRLDA
ncbi:MAG: 30S ribosomal protein S6 [Clostridiales bacterium]|jgi:small subunit ribosomal protein S6|nr:30S ribosomal protein S6 [Clostridiales bacterium]